MSAVTVSTNARAMITRHLRARRLTDQIGRVLLASVLVVTAAVYLVAPLQAAMWLQTPFIALMEPPRNINGTLSPIGNIWPSQQVGLQPQDEILAVDGQSVGDVRDIYAQFRQHEIGDGVTLDVASPGAAPRQVRITLWRLPMSDVLTLFVVPYIVGLMFVALGLWVYRQRREQDVGRIFLLFCASLALVLGTTFDLWSTHTFVRLWITAIPLTAGILLTFALVFPNETPLIAKSPVWRWAPLLLAAGFTVWAQIQMSGPNAARSLAWQASYNLAGLAVVAFVGALLGRALFAPSPSVREQSRVVLAASVFSFVPFLIWLIDYQIISIVFVMALFLLFPLAIAYSIVQYSELDSNRLLSFTATYSIMAIMVVVGYALIVAGISFVTAAAFQQVAISPVLVAIVAFGLVVAFQPLRSRIQTVIDRMFFRSRAEYQERLTQFRHDLTLASGLTEIVRLLKQQVRETIMPTHLYIFLRDPLTGEFVAAGEGNRPDTDIRFDAASGVIHALSTTRDIIFLEPNRPLPPEMVEDHAKLAVLRTPLMAPLQGQDRLAGWVAIGTKRSGDPLSIEDLRFVEALAEQASLAVERAQVIGDLERRVRELDVLSQVSQAVNFTTDPAVLLELIYTQTSKLIDTTNFYIAMHHPDTRTLSYAFFVENDERHERREGEHWPDDMGLVSEVIRTWRPIRTDDYLAECQRLGIKPVEANAPYAWMGVPLNAGARTLGAIIISSFTKGVSFTEDQLKIFWAIADQAATALDKARLFTETETRARQLATLNEISKDLSSIVADLETLLVRIMRAAVDILGTEAGSLFLVDEETQELVFRVVEGGAQNLVGTRLPPGVGIVGEAAVSGQPVIVNNVMQDRRWFSDVDRETEFQTHSLLAVPLRIQDQSIGVLEVINKRDGSAFGEEDISLLTTFAAQASVAIQNARLYEATDAELAARVDELQNLQRIDRELNRTLRLDRVIQITLDWALRTTGAQAGAVVMRDADGEHVEVLAANGYRDSFKAPVDEQGMPQGILQRVLTAGKPEFIRNANENDSSGVAEAQMAVPLLRANQPIGALLLESTIASLLSETDFEFIQRLVEHAAVAIENARLLGEVEQANKSKTEFISFVAHELKNPMTSIRGYTDLLKGGQVGAVTDMQVQFLATIRSNVDRMSRLVSDLADVARIEAGQLRLEMSPISVKSVVDETVRGLKGQIEEKNQTLNIELPDDLPPILADHTRMVQVMTNLLSNAHKYTPDGGAIWVGASIETVPDDKGGLVKVVHHWVRDTGIGMSEEELQQLFQKFFRTQRGKDMAQGTGLGLNITKNLVERHNGTVWVESEVGQGTTFHYTVPAAVETEKAES